MEKQIKYVQLSADNAENCKVFESLMYEYIDEMNEHSERPLPKEFQQKWINSIIAMQGPTDRHLELCYVGEMPIGFLCGKIILNQAIPGRLRSARNCIFTARVRTASGS